MLICAVPASSSVGKLALTETVTPALAPPLGCQVPDQFPLPRLTSAIGGSPLLNVATTEPVVREFAQSSTTRVCIATGKPAGTAGPVPSCVKIGRSLLGWHPLAGLASPSAAAGCIPLL